MTSTNTPTPAAADIEDNLRIRLATEICLLESWCEEGQRWAGHNRVVYRDDVLRIIRGIVYKTTAEL